MKNPFELNEYQQSISNLVKNIAVPAKYSAISCLRHINKAEKIIVIDPEMCAFRLITAEEEAATALFLSLKNLKYPDAKKLEHKTHLHKNALLPFFECISVLFGQDIINQMKPRFEYHNDTNEVKLSIKLDESHRINAVPPFNLTLTKNDKEINLTEEMNKLADSKNFPTFLKYLEKRAHDRNLLLYAGNEGLYKVGQIDDKIIQSRLNGIFLILSILSVIEQNREIQSFITHAIRIFLIMTNKIAPAKND